MSASVPSGTFIVHIIDRKERIPYYVTLEQPAILGNAPKYRARCYWRDELHSSRLRADAKDAVEELKQHIWQISSIEAHDLEQEALAKWNEGKPK